jgi:predicted choloylglycine hydrolase
MIGDAPISMAVAGGIFHGGIAMGKTYMGAASVGNVVGHDFVGKMLVETADSNNRWEQSLGLTHSLISIPHHIAVGVLATEVVTDRRKRHAILAANGATYN